MSWLGCPNARVAAAWGTRDRDARENDEITSPDSFEVLHIALVAIETSGTNSFSKKGGVGVHSYAAFHN